MKEEKVIVIDINLSQSLLILLTLLTAAFLGHLGWNEDEVAASSQQAPPAAPLASSASMRQYYLTKTGSDGAHALTLCASGYHMASMWEIVDPSNLKYNTTLGLTTADSGQGPAISWGRVRTGFFANTSTTTGYANCNAWTSATGGEYGTAAQLPWGWLTTAEPGLYPPNFSVWRVAPQD